jgi:hypothetical protein
MLAYVLAVQAWQLAAQCATLPDFMQSPLHSNVAHATASGGQVLEQFTPKHPQIFCA